MASIEFSHPYLPITSDSEKEMLEAINKESLEDLFCNIPEEFRLKHELDLPESHTEMEVAARIRELAGKNMPSTSGRVFLGAGVGIHYIPAVVSSLASRSEFLTSYTSYQPEISQGMLQTLFEYQSFMAELLEIDVVNSSMYDMATALGEAAKMATRVKKGRSKFLVPGTINPINLKVLHTYTDPVGIEVEQVEYDSKSGLLSLSDLESKLDDQVAGVYVENPSYLGFLETQVDQIEEATHQAGALLVAGVDVLSLGLIRPPGDYSADIVIGEGQVLGSPITYGGPLLGIFGCIDDMKIIRQMPGRLVGITRTTDEPHEQGFVLTLSPREQHIRRERATSNICSNQAIAAVTAAIYIAVMGPVGIRQLSETIALKSNYAAKMIDEIPGAKAPSIGSSFWKEFVVTFENNTTAHHVHSELLKKGFHGGKILTNEFPRLGESMLFCVTEFHSEDAIVGMAGALRDILTNGGGAK
ncbi:MAG: aminomethyl-transferring glycine dehydrogenase subunit GcvPA [Candidatus Thorarchaeota archaeon]|nr:MAG: aminomethyl-transferring glycine dehydrogenase subunit GcvPA [Candidatus Thorarchaeota archaeon]